MVRSLRSERMISRTSAIGLRLGPQPPIPIVIPLFSWATTSPALICLFIFHLVRGSSSSRHSREGGNPVLEPCLRRHESFPRCRAYWLDSRLRGNDEIGGAS